MIFILALAVIVASVIVAQRISRVVDWQPAGPIVMIALAPLLPRVNVVLGIGLDDLLPLVGLAMLLPVFSRALYFAPRPGPVRFVLVGAAVGMSILVIMGAVSSAANGNGLLDAAILLTRSSGRFLFLTLIVCGLALAVRERPDGSVLAGRALAIMGTAEAVFGLVAFLVPLPDRIGLAGTRPWSVLWGEIPGRVSGTLGLSPNFTGAVLMVSLLVTVGLAARPVRGRERAAWLLGALLQFTVLVLTFSRAPLGAAVIGLVALLLIVSRPVLLAPLAALLGLLSLVTPLAGRFLSDVTDRLALWYSATLVMLDHPLFGVGPGRMNETMRTNPDRYMNTPFGHAVNNAHNTILLSGAEMGVVAAIGSAVLNASLAVLAVFAILRNRGRRADAHVVAGAIGLLAFLVQGMVNNLMTVGVTSVMGAFVTGAFVLPGLLWRASRQPA